jgi:hypothetical protein
VVAGYAVDAFGSRAVVVALVVPLLAALWLATRIRQLK